MGGIISHLQSGITTITSVIRTLSAVHAKYQSLLQRVHAGPFTPVDDPTVSYWMQNPPFPEISDIQGDLPAEADVVIIGSGITGAAAARTVLELSSSSKLTVVVLEARQLCSGATARNGGHIKCAPHEEFARLRRTLGEEKARKVVRMQMRHLEVLRTVDEQMGGLGEVRAVETVDVCIEREGFDKLKGSVEELRAWMPEVEACVWEGDEAREKFGVNQHVFGAISYQAGALWPFRLVTGIWNDLMKRYPNLIVSTHTLVSSITCNGDAASTPYYEVHASRGVLRAKHILHATNGYTGHLVPALRGCLTGVIGHMTAQRPGSRFEPACHGDRSWSVIYGNGFDYVTQRPDGADGSAGDLMLGGGLFRSKDNGLDQVGVWDDGRMDAFPLMHLRGSMATIFEPRWGGAGGGGGELKAAWTGIMGFTGDMLPFVGRLPPGLDVDARGGGQWLAAGFNGEGMVWAWLSGVAAGIMMLGLEEEEEEQLDEAVGRPGGRLDEWFPVEEVRIDAARLRRADLTNLAGEV